VPAAVHLDEQPRQLVAREEGRQAIPRRHPLEEALRGPFPVEQRRAPKDLAGDVLPAFEHGGLPSRGRVDDVQPPEREAPPSPARRDRQARARPRERRQQDDADQLVRGFGGIGALPGVLDIPRDERLRRRHHPEGRGLRPRRGGRARRRGRRARSSRRRLSAVGLTTAGDRRPDRASPIGRAVREVPDVPFRAEQSRLPEQPIDARRIPARPEGEQGAERQVGFGLRGIARDVAEPQGGKLRPVRGGVRPVKEVGIVQVGGGRRGRARRGPRRAGVEDLSVQRRQLRLPRLDGGRRPGTWAPVIVKYRSRS
jgi:hypothetical protein